MNKFDVKVKINVLNQLRLLRNSTFKDKLTFLDEIIQNAQRAKAKNVFIEYESYNDIMIIENDGQILKNPQVLFSMSDSGWDDDVKNTENPFGVGFFSVITVSDYVEIFTGNLRVVFDVAKMLTTNNTDILVEETEKHYDGFKLILHNFKIEDTYYTDIEERVTLLGKYIHELDIYFNGKKKEKKNLTEGDGSPFEMSINEGKLFKGWMAFQSGWSTEGLNIFYKGRLVTKFNSLPYLKGDLHITDKALNLKQPDRKDIIHDNKYFDFVDMIKMYAEMLSEESLLKGKQKDVDEYASVLSRYSNKEEIKKKMKFTVFKGDSSNDITYLRGMALTMKNVEKDEIKSLREYEVYLREEESKEEGYSEFRVEENVSHTAPKAKGVIHHEATSYSEENSHYKEAYTERPAIDEEEMEESVGERIIEEEQPTFWMRFSELERYEQHFNIIKHYGLKLIIARNKLEEELLVMMIDLNVLHIKELKENIKIEATISNQALTVKEKRAVMLLDMVSRMNGFEENVFLVGDLMVLKTTTIEILNQKYEQIEEEVVAMYSKSQNKVLVDRTIIDNSMLEESLDTDITLADYKFVLANLPVLIHQLKMLNCKDKNNLLERTIKALAIA